MKIGYAVEGSTDRAFLEGLRRRWCPHAELIEGHQRGRLRQSREIPAICLELQSKGADIIVFLRDANNDVWRDVLKKDMETCRSEHKHLAVFGVCDGNIECWLCADSEWIARQTGRSPSEFQVEDPKKTFESAIGISARDRKEEEIATLVCSAPLRNWLAFNSSFENFYGNLWLKSKELGYSIENLRERV